MKILTLYGVSIHSTIDIEDIKVEFLFESKREQDLFFEKLRRGCLSYLEKKDCFSSFRVLDSQDTFELIEKSFWTSSPKMILEIEKQLQKKLKTNSKFQYEGAIRFSKEIKNIVINQLFDFK